MDNFNRNILKRHFIEGMHNKDFESFERVYPTLLQVILKSMNEVSNNPIRDIRNISEFLAWYSDHYTETGIDDEHYSINDDRNYSREEVAKAYLEFLS